MNVLITYDISNQNPEVKAAMLKRVFLDYWTNNQKTYNLPNTTLWKKGDNITVTTVRNEFDDVVAKLNAATPLVKFKIRVERLVIVEFTTWDAIEGDEHSNDLFKKGLV